MSIRLLGSILKQLDFFLPCFFWTLLNWLKLEGDFNHVKFCMTSSLFDLVPILCLKLITPTLFFTFPYTFMKRCFIWEGKQDVVLCCQKIVLLSLSHFSIPSLDLFQITLNLIWKWVIRIYIMYKALWQYLVWWMYASVTLKKIYLQCILDLSQISCGSLSIEAHSCFTV